MTNCALFSTVVQVRILNDQGLVLHSSKTLEISVRANTTDQPLTGTTSVFFNSSLGFAVFTNLAFMQPQRLVKLIFQCEGCSDSGGAKVAIGQESVPFKITPAFERLAYVQPRPSAKPFLHPIVAGEVSGLIVLGLLCSFSSLRSHEVLTSQCRVSPCLWVNRTQDMSACRIMELCFNYTMQLSSFCADKGSEESLVLNETFGYALAKIFGLSLHYYFSAVILGEIFEVLYYSDWVCRLFAFLQHSMSRTTLWILELSLSNMVDRAYMNTDLHSLYGLLNGQVPCRLLRSE
jgi:hypothetical protein